MQTLDARFAEIGHMDTLARGTTFLHRLDPRAKVLTAAAFIVAVVSFGKYEVSALTPFFLYPVVLVSMGRFSPAYLLRKIVLAAPFAVMIGLFNPFLDRTVLVHAGPWGISGGWISFLSILLRFSLTVGAALLLVASTGIHAVCLSLDQLGVPRVFTVQLLFLYRYLFVLVEEGLRMVRAWVLRAGGRHGMSARIYGHLVGHLLLRSLDRSQRIHLAMTCRGFDGRIRLPRSGRFGFPEILFTGGWIAFCVTMRLIPVPRLLGAWLTGGMS